MFCNLLPQSYLQLKSNKMERYANVLLIAIPFFTILIIIEKIYAYLKGEEVSPSMDTISSLSSGATNIVKDVLKISFVIMPYAWMVEHLAIFQLKSSIFMYVIVFFVIDFQGYWTHRWAHEVNIFWNKHAIHHSSEEFDLPCALRQSISVFVNLFTFFLLPAAILGVPKEVVFTVAPLHLFAQFWYHTRHIGKMGFLEKIIVTPSHHRVHHAKNPLYLDKNHGQILIIWDKIFGTFQEELAEVPPVYGILYPSRTWNPIKINFHHFWRILQDAWHAQSWKDKIRIWFMQTGWRPDDVNEKYPLPPIEDPYTVQKYNSHASTALIVWSYLQLNTLFLFIFYLFLNIAKISQVSAPNIYIYGVFIFLTVYSYTELMDLNPFAIVWEGIRVLFGIGLLMYVGDWFGLNTYIPWGNHLIISMLMFSFLGTFYFVLFECKKKLSLTQEAI